MNKIKVKSLQGSPFVISQEPSDRIGGGAYAKVVKAYNTQDLKQKLVAKIIPCKDAQRAATIKAEVEVLKRVQHHPNLVNCAKFQLSSQNNFYLIMEYCNGGSLEDLITKQKYLFSEIDIKEFLHQFCEGYKVLIKANLIHRDIKPDNIMINNNVFKIADFGFSKVIEEVKIDFNMSTKGTPLYMAPELLTKGGGSNKVDVFSLGTILFRLAYKGLFPFYNPKKRYGGKQEYIKQMIATPLVFPGRPQISKELKDLISRMLEKDRDLRISWQDIFEHDFLKFEKGEEEGYKSGMVSTANFNKQIQITNNSVLNVNLNHKKKQQLKQQPNKVKEQIVEESESSQSNVYEDLLVMEKIISNQSSTNLCQKLYTIKRIYTLIEHVSRKILKPAQSSKIPSFIQKTILNCVTSSLQYSLYQIKQLQTLSGSWSQVEQQIKSLETIFNQDRQILTQLLLKVSNKQRYMHKQFQLCLYEILTEFPSYPEMLKSSLVHQIRFMIDIYDYLNGKTYQQEERMLEAYIRQIEEMTREDVEKEVMEMLKSRGMFIC